jgi:hypothetical protein
VPATSSGLHWGLLGALLGLAHIGPALESVGDHQTIKRLCSFAATLALTTKVVAPATSSSSSDSAVPVSNFGMGSGEAEGAEGNDAARLLVNGSLVVLASLTGRAFRLDDVNTDEISWLLDQLQARFLDSATKDPNETATTAMGSSDAEYAARGSGLAALASLAYEVACEGYAGTSVPKLVQSIGEKCIAVVSGSSHPNLRIGAMIALSTRTLTI